MQGSQTPHAEHDYNKEKGRSRKAHVPRKERNTI